MSVLAIHPYMRASNYVPMLDPADSPAAKELRRDLTNVFHFSGSLTAERVERGEELIDEAAREARQQGVAIRDDVIAKAAALIWTLPSHVPLPEIIVEDDGSILLDWD